MRLDNSPLKLISYVCLGLFSIISVCVSAASDRSEDWKPVTRDEAITLISNTPEGVIPDLQDLDFRNQDMSGIDFKGANLHGTHMKGVNLSKSNFENSNMDITILRGANLEGANLRNTSLKLVIIGDANMKGADLSGARVVGNFERSNLEGAKLVDLRAGVNMKNQSMGMAIFYLVKANLTNADLTNADMSICNAKFADFTGANLTGANLSDCALVNADFTGANLTGTDLTGANIQGAIFKDITGKDTIIGLDETKGFKFANFD